MVASTLNPKPLTGRSRRRFVTVGLLVLIPIGMGMFWFFDARTPRARAARVAAELCFALEHHSAAAVVKLIELPPAMRTKGDVEIQRQVLELLSDEISTDGVAALKKHGSFGALREIFPAEAAAWAAAFSVSADECVAFRMEKNGIRAEVVLLQTADGFRILRCNNVKQMASATSKS